MFTALAITLVVLAIVVHEAGHAWAMKRYGVQIESAGIGFGPGITLRPKRLGFPVKISPLVIGAYVKPSQAGATHMESLCAREQAVIYAAGPLMNIATAGIILVLLIGGLFLTDPSDAVMARLIALGVLALLALACYRWLEAVSLFVVPLVGALNLFALVWLLLAKNGEGVDGPIGIVELAISSSLKEAIVMGFIINVGLAITNMLPIPPLDGGRIVLAALKERLSIDTLNKVTAAGVLTVLALMIFVIGNDLASLL